MKIIGGRHEAGMAMSIRADHRDNTEPWVTAATIEALCAMGHEPDRMHPEMRVASGCRPDLVVEGREQVVIFESKRRRPTNGNRRQVRRYISEVARRWPEREVIAFLVWPGDELRYPFTEYDLNIEAVR